MITKISPFDIIKFAVTTSLAIFAQTSLADSCTDNLSSAITNFNTQCSGTTQCWGTHPEGYDVPTGKFVSVAPVSKIDGVNIALSCNATSSCPPHTHPGTGSSLSIPLCNNLPYVNASIVLAQNLNPNNQIACGSIVGVDDQTLGESIPLKGAKFSLNYFSHFNPGRGNYTINLPLTSASPAADTTSFSIKVTSSDGEYANVTLPNQANLTYSFSWNGRSKANLPVYGTKGFKIEWVQNFSTTSETITLSDTAILGGFNATALGIGGWVPSIYKYYNPVTQQLFSGDGSVQNILATEVTNITGIKYMIAEKDRSLIHYFDDSGRIKYSQTGTTGGTVMTYAYDPLGVLRTMTEPFSLQTSFQRTGPGVLYNIVAPRGSYTPPSVGIPGASESNVNESGVLITRVAFDSNGRLIKARTLDGPQGGTNNPFYQMTYDSRGLLLTFKKPNGDISTYTYDLAGNLIKDQKSNGYFFELIKTINSSSNSVVVKSDSAGNTDTYDISFGGGSNLSRTSTTLDGVQNSISYSDYNTTYNGGGVTQSTQYTPDSRVAGAQYPTTESISFGANSWTTNTSTVFTYTPGNSSPSAIYYLKTTKDFGTSRNISFYEASTKTYSYYRQRPGTTAGPTTKIVIDSYERPTSIKRGSLTATSIAYTQENISSIIQGSNATYFKYNTLNQLTGIGETATTNKVTYSYNDLGRLSSQVNQSGHTINYAYDSNGNVTSIQATPGRTHLFTFNLYDSISSWVTPLNKTTSYVYNLNQTLSKVTKPSGKELNYTYGLSKRLNKITSFEGEYSFVYDSNTGLLSAVKTPDNYVTEFTMDGPNAKTITNKDPALNDIGKYTVERSTTTGTILSDTASIGSAQSTVSYVYDLDLRRSQAGDMTIQYDANDLISGTTIGAITETFTRDTEGVITARIVKYNNVVKFSETLTLNSKKKVTSVQLLNNYTDSFSYDDDYRLLDSQRTYSGTPAFSSSKTYNYSPANGAGNNQLLSIFEPDFVRTWFTYNNDDELTNYSTISIHTYLKNINYTYTQDGQLSTRSDTVFGENSAYSYDGFGNLKQVVISSNGKTIDYEIDGLGRRIGKKLNGVVQRRWIYQDKYRIAAETDAAGNITKRFIYATDRHVPDYMVIGAEKYKLVSDRLGSIKLILKVSDGSIVQENQYTDSGNSDAPTDPTFIPFGFAGGLVDWDTKLIHFGAREYDPTPGRWTTKDPIGFNGGDTNLYGYVANDPINHIDPTGLICNYSQSSGTTICSDINGNITMINTKGYAGNGQGYNNPNMQNVPNVGPLPQGSYTVGEMVSRTPSGLINALPLTPNDGTNTYGRGGFFIHGDNPNRPPGTSSNGCPIINSSNRSLIPPGETFNVGQ